jgi:8-oxo-dGTP diphosphatase
VYLTEINHVEPPFCNEGELHWIPYSNLLDVPTPQTDWYIYKYLMDSKPFMFNVIYDAQLEMLSMVEAIENIALPV